MDAKEKQGRNGIQLHRIIQDGSGKQQDGSDASIATLQF
jgi:hypothetical protein